MSRLVLNMIQYEMGSFPRRKNNFTKIIHTSFLCLFIFFRAREQNRCLHIRNYAYLCKLKYALV